MRVVFVGPSAHGLPDEHFAGLERRPPARRGDLPEAGRAGAKAILLVDGAFGDAPTVSHKEILGLLAQGIRVGGAASLGAIRAAECAPFGMAGVGEIFQDYASGRRTSDADVMLCHAPDELRYAPVSVSLVDLEASLRALPANALTLAEIATLLARARALHFSMRTLRQVAEGLPPDRRVHAVRALKCHRAFRKRYDLKLGLNWLRHA